MSQTDTRQAYCERVDCYGAAYTKGLCRRHYMQSYRDKGRAQDVTNARADRCEALQPVRSDGGETFYVRCNRQGTEEKPHQGRHEATLRAEEGFGWKVSWE